MTYPQPVNHQPVMMILEEMTMIQRGGPSNVSHVSHPTRTDAKNREANNRYSINHH